jgi:hypothetical protein
MGFTETFWAPKYEVLIGAHLLLRGLRLRQADFACDKVGALLAAELSR